MRFGYRLADDLGLWLGSSITVNLEVKRRMEVLRMAQEHELSVEEIFGAGLEDEDGNSKFRESTSSEVNVLALTLLGEIDQL